jgi:hypothetical protein
MDTITFNFGHLDASARRAGICWGVANTMDRLECWTMNSVGGLVGLLERDGKEGRTACFGTESII